MGLNDLQGYVSCRLAPSTEHRMLKELGKKKISGAMIKTAVKMHKAKELSFIPEFIHALSGSFFGLDDAIAASSTLNIRYNNDRDVCVVRV